MANREDDVNYDDTNSDEMFEEIDGLLKEHGIGTATISDVLDASGERNRVLSPELRLLGGKSDGVVHGAAITVQWHQVRKGPAITEPGPSTWVEVRDFVVPDVTDGRRCVYVAGSGELMRNAAMLGGLSVTYLTGNLGFEAVVAGGAVRDRRIVENAVAPVIGTSYVPIDSQGAFEATGKQGFCIVDGVMVQNGDWIFIDGDGVIIVPRRIVIDVLAKCAEIEDTESDIFRRLAQGQRLPDLIDTIGRI